MLNSIADILKEAQTLKTKILVVAKANDEHVLKAIKAASDEDIVNAVLIDDKNALLKTMKSLNMDEAEYEIVDIEDKVKASEEAVKRVSQSKDSILMKGLVDTSVILRAVLSKDFGLRGKNRLSHVSVIENPHYHKLLTMSDGAMNIAPDVSIKREIIENAVEVTKALGIDTANVAVLAAVEKVNDKMQATLDAETLKNETFDSAIVDGPFALDNAIDKEAAEHKGITSPMAGDADILLMPMIEAGNIFYKSMMFLSEARSASVIMGATHPIVLTSRADTFETKFHSIALAALIAAIK
ncbi:MAG: phosphate acyltransferase [Bacillota bacterium]